jgi:signal transduction histidine kinase
VAAVAVPLLLLSVGLYLARARTEQQEARETALRIAKATAARMSRLRADSNAMLQRMALPPSVRDVNAHSCDSLFAIIDFFPKYANLFLFDANAVLVCAAQPQAEDQKVSAVARQWIERELRARRLTPGATQILPVDREWVSITSVAVTNARGAITGTLVLLELPEVFGLEALPAGAVVTIVDRNGTIVARTADHVHWTGRNVRERPVTRIAMRRKEGVTEAIGVDGVSRQYGFTWMPEVGWYVYVGVPTAAVMAPVRRTFIEGIAGGTAIVLAVLFVAAMLAGQIQRPIRALSKAANALAQGGYGEVAVERGPLEIVRLAETFNAMVQRREAAEGTLHEGERKLKALSDRLLVLQEQERTRIARELHDDLGQSLTALKMDFLGVLGAIPATEANRRTRERIAQTLDATVSAVQRISSELRPSILDDLGLVAAIESEARLFEERTGIECELSLPDAPLQIDAVVANAVYRIVQESLTNVSRHSNASRVELRLRPRAEALLLDVRDDGRGVTEDELQDPASLGLIGIRERAAIVGGTADFQGISGRGTIVSVSVPRTAEGQAS